MPDRVRVLLDRRLDDLLRGLVEAGVDDLHAGVAERARDDLRAAVVPVEAGLRDDDADLPLHGIQSMTAGYHTVTAPGWRRERRRRSFVTSGQPRSTAVA